MSRLTFLVIAAVALLGACSTGTSAAQADLQKQADLYAIDQIEVDWHKAASMKDVNLMMTLWADDATFSFNGRTLTGKDQLRAFFANEAAPFKAENHWESIRRRTRSGPPSTATRARFTSNVTTSTSTHAQVKVVVAADQKVARINGKWVITEADASSPGLLREPNSTRRRRFGLTACC